MALTRLSLSDRSWALRPLTSRAVPAAVADALDHGPLSAQVPGCVHTDLLRLGLIADPLMAGHEGECLWIGHEQWRYETTLPALKADKERHDLVADGLDTLATIRLGGEIVAHTANQHRSYRFDVTSALAGRGDGEMPLAIDFASVYDYAAAVRDEWGEYPSVSEEPFNYVRKMASNFGWDWGPVVTTAGVWKDIRIESWSTARLAAVRPTVTVDGARSNHGRVVVRVEVERSAAGHDVPLVVTAKLESRSHVEGKANLAAGETAATIELDAGEVNLWWPHGVGAQALYRLDVTVHRHAPDALGPDSADDLLDQWDRRIGFRHAELVTNHDEIGSSFGFRIGGHPFFVRGFNWIPDDLFISRVTEADYRLRLTDAKAAGANLIRVWGGGIFESDAFYDLCDEMGLIVWQDFPFACAAYPENDAFAAEVAAEAADNITRLMAHPSLLLWNGCNENFLGYEEWGWKGVLGGRAWGERYYLELLPDLVNALDPARPYWPGSPYSGPSEGSNRPGHAPNDPDWGCVHSWDVWNQLDYPHYSDDRPRFVTEFGWCAPAAATTLAEGLGADHLDPADPVLMAHNRADDGAAKLRRAIGHAFGEVVGFDAWHYAAQIQQARAVRYGVEYWRSLWPRCQGAVVWQLNDCWPAISWSAVDSSGRYKPVWYTVRNAFAPHLAVVRATEPGAGTSVLALVNHSIELWSATPMIRRVGLDDGGVRAQWSDTIPVTAGSVVEIALPKELDPASLGDDEILVIDSDPDDDPSQRTVIARPDHELHYPQTELAVTAWWDDDCVRVRATAATVVRDLLLQADRLGGVSQTVPVTLLPGETFEWTITGVDRAPNPEELVFPVLTSAGDIVRSGVEHGPN
ncbi:MAG: glycoside hydrolase family 2 protein [Propionibacteriaceae bacterium]|jgi:beta-mannosidase|nr:glycoside hydrolase family 2 protein [Propionibacteriaceae bacterium]